MPIRRRSLVLAVAAVAVAALGAAAGVAAAGNTMRIEPAGQSVAEGASFTVRVVHDASVAISGAQATVTFDRAKVQITTVTRGDPHKDAPIFVPSDMKPTIAAANKSGKLKTIATAFIPPASVPAGDADFLVIGFKAVGCGTSELGLPVGSLDAVLLDGRPDTYGNALKVTTTGGKITVDCGAASSPAGGATPAPPPAATSAPAPDATPPPDDAGQGTSGTLPDATPPPEGAVDDATANPPGTATLPLLEAASTADPWVVLLLGLAAVAASVVAVDVTRHLVRRNR